MKIKTLLFGAGAGAITFIHNTQAQREFIGFIDNDKAKHGKQLAGLHIYPPSSIENFDFDEIVISTQWALDVQRQLLDNCQIPPEKVLLPQKNLFKKIQPFANLASLQLGRTIIGELSELAVIRKLPLVVDFGTLLGLTRDGDIIPWDDDIDFSAPVEYAKNVELLLSEFVRTNKQLANWKVEKVVNKINQKVGFLLTFDDQLNRLSQFTTSLCLRQNNNGMSEHMPSLGMWSAPSIHFEQVDMMQWQGKQIQVPHQHREYLSYQYGDWITPKKDIQLSDYDNLQQVEFADIQAAGFTAQELLGTE
ncbi:LicD family protein [uncultured Paraglaciecola sp.]|uniref:nucleoside-diphosphate sugar epimerase/dehydratase n=1 Tax=uncultured Paraglaciecola sp. TaxID=1765024 RepID=UPI0026171195|nr:LicD family protein [uncultured Paraglaciecola sp.]